MESHPFLFAIQDQCIFLVKWDISIVFPWLNMLELRILLVRVLCLVAQLCPTLCDPMDCSPPGSSVHGNSPGKNTGVGCLALLQEIFPTQGLNSGLSHCKQILYHLSRQGSPFCIHCLTILKSHNRDFIVVKDIGFTISTEHPSRFLLKLRNMTMAKQFCMSCGILVPWPGVEPVSPTRWRWLNVLQKSY